MFAWEALFSCPLTLQPVYVLSKCRTGKTPTSPPVIYFTSSHRLHTNLEIITHHQSIYLLSNDVFFTVLSQEIPFKAEEQQDGYVLVLVILSVLLVGALIFISVLLIACRRGGQCCDRWGAKMVCYIYALWQLRADEGCMVTSQEPCHELLLKECK